MCIKFYIYCIIYSILSNFIFIEASSFVSNLHLFKKKVHQTLFCSSTLILFNFSPFKLNIAMSGGNVVLHYLLGARVREILLIDYILRRTWFGLGKERVDSGSSPNTVSVCIIAVDSLQFMFYLVLRRCISKLCALQMYTLQDNVHLIFTSMIYLL